MENLKRDRTICNFQILWHCYRFSVFSFCPKSLDWSGCVSGFPRIYYRHFHWFDHFQPIPIWLPMAITINRFWTKIWNRERLLLNADRWWWWWQWLEWRHLKGRSKGHMEPPGDSDYLSHFQHSRCHHHHWLHPHHHQHLNYHPHHWPNHPGQCFENGSKYWYAWIRIFLNYSQ